MFRQYLKRKSARMTWWVRFSTCVLTLNYILVVVFNWLLLLLLCFIGCCWVWNRLTTLKCPLALFNKNLIGFRIHFHAITKQAKIFKCLVVEKFIRLQAKKKLQWEYIHLIIQLLKPYSLILFWALVQCLSCNGKQKHLQSCKIKQKTL